MYLVREEEAVGETGQENEFKVTRGKGTGAEKDREGAR